MTHHLCMTILSGGYDKNDMSLMYDGFVHTEVSKNIDEVSINIKNKIDFNISSW